MAPIKFENNIKDKLDKRTLQPSNNAWDKLSERLDNQEKKKHNKPILWLGVAASIVGVLLVVTQFFNTKTSIDNVPKTVVIPEVVKPNTNKAIAIEALVDIEKASGNIQKNRKEITKEEIKKSVLATQELNKKQTTIVQENDIEKLKEKVDEPLEVREESLTFEQEKIQAVANRIQTLKDNNTVTDDAIDALLLEAQKEIMLNKLYNEATGVVDANLLLQDVETELDQSFRSKVFEVIKASYGTVKTAVAQRND